MTETKNLAGRWDFALGEEPDYRDSILLPGSLQAQGFGHEVTTATSWTGEIVDRSWFTEDRWASYRQPGNIKVPFWLQPEKHYVSAAWYRREIEIPEAWGGRRVVLTLERAHIRTTVFLDGREAGSRDSLAAPHVYDLGCRLAPGRHHLAIRVDNRLHVDVGSNSSSVTDHTQTNWNGIIGRLELTAGSPVWIDDAQVFPDIARKSVRIRVAIGNATGRAGRGILSAGDQGVEAAWDGTGGTAELDVPLGGEAKLWDEFDPVLHRLTLRLGEDEKTVAFGLRQPGVRGTQITLNGRPIFLRGTLECCVFPRTGYPPTDAAEWKRVLATIKDYGFNHVRFHSWCPPEAAFAAADELGLYLQVECSSWANGSAALGEGLPLDEWLHEEALRIVRSYGNHPSFLLLACGNEPGRNRAKLTEYLTRWVGDWKQRDRRRLYTTAAGWPAIPENDFHNIPEPRAHRWGEGLDSSMNRLPPATTADYSRFIDPEKIPETLRRLREKDSASVPALEAPAPIVSHEIGQWCVYPDFSEIPKYTGLLKAKNFEIFRETLEASPMAGQARDFLMASGRLQVLCYREEIEAALRTRGFGGFQILQANDFPGQGTALVGWLNPFWESKGYTSPEEFRRFNHSTVPLARLEKRLFSREDTLRGIVEIAHFGAADIGNAEVSWTLTDTSGRVHASGKFPPLSLPTGGVTTVGAIAVSLRDLPAPGQYRLAVALEGTHHENDWDLWVYPPTPGAGVLEENKVPVAHTWDDLLRQAAPGGKILFNPPPSEVAGDVALGFSPIFWNTSWTKKQAPHTLGILCDPRHPLFARFPTDFHTDWQWWELIHGAAAMVLDGLPPEVRPLVQIVDDWFTNRRLGLVFEACVDDCEILVCSSDIASALDERHAARQFRHSLLEYMAGPAFRPRHRMTPASLHSICSTPLRN